MTLRLRPEASSPLIVQLERDDVPLDRIGDRTRVGEILTRYDRPGVEHVESSEPGLRRRVALGAEAHDLARREGSLHRRQTEVAPHVPDVLLGDRVLAG